MPDDQPPAERTQNPKALRIEELASEVEELTAEAAEHPQGGMGIGAWKVEARDRYSGA